MAQAATLEDRSAQGDTLDAKHSYDLEMSISPLMDEVFIQPDSVEDMLGQAPRRTFRNSPSSPKDLSPTHHTRLLEVLPMTNRLLPRGDLSWVIPLKLFSSKKSKAIGLETNRLPRGIRAYYERQDDLINAYEAMATESKLTVLCDKVDDSGVLATRLSQISFLVNLGLMIAKALAVKMSNSLSIISSLVDSVVDLISGIIIWWTSHAIRTTNIYVYPVGRSRLEPVAIIILSVIMSLASLEVMISSVRKMIAFGKAMEGIAVFELPTVLIAGSTVVVKFILALSFYLIMKKGNRHSSAIDALIQDHRNDTMSNLVAILCGYLGSMQFANEVNTKQVAYIDPAGAIIIALYIIISWWQTGTAQLRLITGYTADPGFLSQITWIALNHSPKVLKIDTVRAFHFGSKFLVEVDIVLSETTVLYESHDIGEKLQQKLERLPRVERAFVHVDYEYDHRPQDEHQVT
ncbi:metal tolerance protein [Plakobranchus ocellatus]|uniref:Metal tolerance protein n=1 Tax=Plakobranchus ocellatus TaxID=259542 RepID=A0AAV4DFC9_9GAST|nr:metal tolerance protein [Plakobranchus ocellatus]